MEELIKFRSLLDELTDNEYIQFIALLLKSNGKQFFNKLIFDAFKNKPVSIIPITNIIANIMSSRDSEIDKTISISISNECYLDKLPDAVIAETASYLKETQYFQFGQVNRKIYTSIYSPSKIHVLSYGVLVTYPQFLSMRRFQNVKKAVICVQAFDELSNSNKSIWKRSNRINTLQINNNYNNNYSDIDSIYPFFNNNQINFANVSKLELIPIKLNLATFFKIISRFPMLQYLHLNEVYIYNDAEHVISMNDDEIRMYFPKIKGLAINADCDSNLGSKLINALSDQLEALSICNGYVVPSNQKFPKLNELKLYGPNMTLFNMFNNVTTIKSAYIDLVNYENKITKVFIEEIIENQSCLKQLVVEMDDLNDLMIAFESIETTLILTKHKKRKSKQLFIVFDYELSTEQQLTDKIHIGIIRLMNAFETAKITDWRIKFRMHSYNMINMEQWLKELEHLKENCLINYVLDNTYFTFIVSSKDCKICGYQAVDSFNFV